MTGFIRGLFGGNKKEEAPAPQPARQKETQDFFLDFDSARTFGDIERMRKEVEVHKTFPKGTTPVEQPAKPKAKATEPTSSAPASTAGETLERRKADRNLDAFRSMAKDLKK
ncbi:hypothetical protein H6F46_07825 [Limnothrix sp. FACHB-1083]|uniref:hypothetical protein n=1 Tax=unclassified Limnothrix TaxID=2632864 RepID=UPI001680D6E2|nr:MULTISPECIES: hypothetical protein [unclassified Limnothrix]MBD2160600.1 hypothetical protein [Limnothrix sp. FACHB-1083]MBD2191302.1 hypothetical protein [Limnothrix sp. FACHB-1088]